MEGCISIIKQFSPNLSPSEKKAADYLISHPTQAVQLNISSLAEAAGTSSAAVVRMANRMGFKGYSDLRMSLAKEVFSTETTETNPALPDLTPSASAFDVVKALCGLTVNSIEALAQVIDPDRLEQTVQHIVSARYILISGIGASGIVATDLQQKLARLGLLAIYTSDADMQVVQACSLDERDLLVAISYSGETGTVLKAAAEGRRNRVPVVAVTRLGGNSLSKLSDITLLIPNSESLFRQGATSSRINQLLVIDFLYGLIITRTRQNQTGLIKRTWEAVSHVSGGIDQSSGLGS